MSELACCRRQSMLLAKEIRELADLWSKQQDQVRRVIRRTALRISYLSFTSHSVLP
jgi:hypothetical protein